MNKVLVVLIVMISLCPQSAHSAASRPDKVAAALWQATEENQSAEFLVILQQQTDLSAVARVGAPGTQVQAVYDALRTTAQRSQKPLQAWLQRRGFSYQSFYLVNMLRVTGDRALLLALAQRADVARLIANPAVVGVAPLPVESALDTMPHAAAGIEWGVSFVNAPQVWQRGITGTGVVIGVQDTGVLWQHPALRGHYRGWDGGTAHHDFNWHSAVGITVACADPAQPCDPVGHGTHVTGTAVGDDGAGNQIGVAPGAQWIACRNMDDQGRGSPASYIECFEFLLAPYPFGGDPQTAGRPDLGAQIINNSWHCPPSEGCDHFTLQQALEAVRAAGIMLVVSAGNNGSACGSVLYPPGTYDAAYSIGAFDSAGVIAPFSSRGPVTFNGSGLSKPDLSAPGVAVRSASPGNDYRLLSGTSMAAPHVSGVVALIWSANPALIGQIDATEALLNRTARPVADQTCGPSNIPGYNHTYGWGAVDALAALRASQHELYLPMMWRHAARR
ncbi:MAG: S8 family serine peptidase [Caldilineales bacterium]